MKRPPWFWLRALVCRVFGHPWEDEHGPVRGMSYTGSFCARCWRAF